MAHYRPQLFIRTADVNVGLTWPEGVADADEKMVHFLCWSLYALLTK